MRAAIDGASRGNPGEAGIGILIRDERDATVFSLEAHIGRATNNVAEYTALVTVLRVASRFPCTLLSIHSDSELLVRQMNGRYKVRDAGLMPYYRTATRLREELPCRCEVLHVPREENRDADRLANNGIEKGRALPPDLLPVVQTP